MRDSCNLVGCEDGFEIRVVSSEPLAAGRYDFALVLDAVQAGSCIAYLPAGAGITACDVSLPVGISAIDDAIVLRIRADPTVITVRVHHDYELVRGAEFEPDYRTLEPNGPSCEPTCHVADAEELSLTP